MRASSNCRRILMAAMSLTSGWACARLSHSPEGPLAAASDGPPRMTAAVAGYTASFHSPFLPSSDVIATAHPDEGWVALWQATDGTVLARFDGLADLGLFALSPDGARLAVTLPDADPAGVSAGVIRIYALPDGAQLKEVAGVSAYTTDMFFDGAGQRLFVVDALSGLHITDLRTSSQHAEADVLQAVLDRAGRCYGWSFASSRLIVLSPPAYNKPLVVDTGSAIVAVVPVMPDCVLVAGRDGTRLLSLSTNEVLEHRPAVGAAWGPIAASSVHTEGWFVGWSATAGLQRLGARDLEPQTDLSEWPSNEMPVALQIAADGGTIAASVDGQAVRLWDADSGALLLSSEGLGAVSSTHADGEPDWGTPFTFSPSGTLLAIRARPNLVRVVSLPDADDMYLLEFGSETVLSITWSPSSHCLAVSTLADPMTSDQAASDLVTRLYSIGSQPWDDSDLPPAG